MKTKKFAQLLSLSLAAVLCVCLLAGCDGTSSSTVGSDSWGYDSDYTYESSSSTSSSNGLGDMSEDFKTSSGTEVSDDTAVSEDADDTEEKIVYTGTITAETKEYDTCLDTIYAYVSEVGGYVEEFSEYGGSYNTYTGSRNSRDAYFVIRVPSKSFNDAISTVGSIMNITRKNITSSNVTLEYVDLEARIEALYRQQERLNELVDTAADLSDLLQLESEITSVQSQIESAERSLRVLANRVSYSTITLTINETEVYSPTTELTYLQKVKEAFVDSATSLVEGLTEFSLWVVGSFFQLILAAVIIVIIVLIVRKTEKAQKAKRGARSKNTRRKPQPKNDWCLSNEPIEPIEMIDQPKSETPEQAESKPDGDSKQ
jgi:hypothetical protein